MSIRSPAGFGLEDLTLIAFSFRRLVLSIQGHQEVDWRLAPSGVSKDNHPRQLDSSALSACRFLAYDRPQYRAGRTLLTTHAHNSHRILERRDIAREMANRRLGAAECW